MSPALRVRRWVLVSSVLVSWSSAGAASAAEEAVRFEYRAPPACPDEAALATRVWQRTPRGRPAASGEMARTFEIAIVAAPAGFEGAVGFLDEQGARVERTLQGEQCEAVLDGLALIIALKLDATRREEEPERSVALPPQDAPAPSPNPQVVPATPPQASVWRRSSLPALAGGRLGVGADLTTVAHGSDFGLSPQLQLLGQLDWRRALSVRLAAQVGWRGVELDDGRRAALRKLTLQVSACPWRIRGGALALAPCGALDFGSLRVEGELGDKLTHPGADTIAWASLGAQLRLGLHPTTNPFWAELHAGAEFPLRAGHKFQFRYPDATVYQVPWMAASIGAVTGVRFW